MMSQMGVDVDLPSASKNVSGSQPDGVIVTLLPDGGMRVNQTKVEKGDWLTLKQNLVNMFRKTKSQLVIIEGDRKAYLGSAIELMDHARQAGAEKFAIATAPPNPLSPNTPPN